MELSFGKVLHSKAIGALAAVAFFAPQIATSQVGLSDLQNTGRDFAARAFMENRGQWDSRANFLSRTPGLDYWVTDSGLVLDVYRYEMRNDENGIDGLGGRYDFPENEKPFKNLWREGHVVTVDFVASGQNSVSEGWRAANVIVDFFVGASSDHARNVRVFQEGLVKNLYQGVHLRNYYDGASPRYDIVLEPGVNPDIISMRVTGSNGVLIEDGDLVIRTNIRQVRQSGLYAYQPIGNARIEVPVEFELRGDNVVGFKLGDYNPELPIVIDPLVYGSYAGSDSVPFFSTGFEVLNAIAAADTGDLYITGSTSSITFPILDGPYGQFALNGPQDAFVMQMRGDAYTISYAAYLGGSATDSGLGIGIDPVGGTIWLAGTTNSADFPGAINVKGPGVEMWLSRFTINGPKLVPNFSQYYGEPYQGGGTVVFRDFTVSRTGKVYLAGVAPNGNLTGQGFTPWLAGGGGGTADGFIVRFDDDGVSLTPDFKRLIGSTGNADTLGTIAVDLQDNVVVCGTIPFAGTQDTSQPGAAFQTTPGVFPNGRLLRNGDAYIVKIDTNGNTVFSALFGGSGIDSGNAVAVDAAGDIYLTGIAQSFDFPRNADAYDQNFTSAPKMYAAKFSSDGSAIEYSTGLASTGNVQPVVMKADSRGFAVIGGTVGFIHPGGMPANTIPGSIPIVNGINGVYAGGDQNVNPPNIPPDDNGFPSTTVGFVMFVNTGGTNLLYSDYIGDTSNDSVVDLFVDNVGATWIGGNTAPVFNALGVIQQPFGIGVYITPNAFKASPDTANDGFVVKLRINLPVLESVSLVPNDIAGGFGLTSTATVSLREPAPPGGVNMTALLTNPNAASFSAGPGNTQIAFMIPEGETSTQLTIFTLPVANQQTCDVRVTLDNDFKIARLTVNPWLDTFAITPATVVGGNQISARVDLFQPANQDIIVQLSTNRPDLVTLPNPAQIIVPAGAETTNILLQTQGVDVIENATVTASLLGVARNSATTIIPATLLNFTFNPNLVNGGSDTQGTVRLNGRAGSARTVTLTHVAGVPGALINGNPLPVDVTIPAQASEVGFTVTAPFVASSTFTTLRADDGVSQAQGTLFIEDIDILALDLSDTDVISGTVITGQVRLTKAAGAGGFTVNLSSTNPAAGTLSSSEITIPAGQIISQPFTFTAAAVATDQLTTISASRPGFTTRSQDVIVRAISMGLTINPTSVIGGDANATGVLALSAAAPAAGLEVALSSSNPAAASVPATVTIPGGSTSVQFTITTSKVNNNQLVTITATASATVQAAATLNVLAPSLLSVTVSPSTVTGGDNALLTVALNSTAPPGGAVVNLSAAPGGVVNMPASITIPAGASQATATIGTNSVTTDTNVVITASRGGINVNATLTVRSPRVFSITFTPPQVVGGANSTGTVTIDQPAPAGGITVIITSESPEFARPAGTGVVTIPAGSTQATFPVTTSPVSRKLAVRFNATASGSQNEFASGFLFLKP